MANLYTLRLHHRYARMIANGEKSKEFRLLSRRLSKILPGDILDFGDLSARVVGVRRYNSVADIPDHEVPGSGFASLPSLRKSLLSIYWYKPDGAILAMDISPQASTRPLPAEALAPHTQMMLSIE